MEIPQELIDELCCAIEGSRELDEKIAKAIGALPPEATFGFFDPEAGDANYEWKSTDPAVLETYAREGWDEEPIEWCVGLDYTQLMDAAVRLFGDDRIWSVGKRLKAPGFVATTDQTAQSSVGATAPLAMVIAALRALRA